MDDILIIGNDSATINNLVTELHKEFSLKDLSEMNYFLRLQMKYTTEGVHLSQSKYISNLLCKTKMQYANPLLILVTGEEKLYSHGSDPVYVLHLCRSVVGALEYVTITRL